MSPIAFSEMLAKGVLTERPKSNRLGIYVHGDDEAQVTSVVHVVRFGLGVLGATSEVRGLGSGQAPEALAKMTGIKVTIEAESHEPGGPWPLCNEMFDAYFAVLPAAEHEHGVDVHWIDPPESVQAVMSDYGRMGVVTDELFDLSIQCLLEKVGLHKVRVQFWFDERTDHEGNRDCEYGFDILSVAEVK